MPHARKRYLFENLKKLSTFSPLIGVLGHRQVGKTTLLSHFSRDYHTLDTKEVRTQAAQDPDAFIKTLKGHHTVIDEAQLAPDLFFALKERVRKNQKPGQFILSGSVRFTSKKTIRESLTGRIQYLELLPFSIAEIEQDPLPNRIHKILESNDLQQFSAQLSQDKKTHLNKKKSIDLYLKQGGLPGISFIRNDVVRKNKIADQLTTILDRDLRQVYKTTLSLEQIENFCRILSTVQGNPIQYSEIKKESELTAPTQQKILNALESVFLIRRIPIEGGMKGFTVLFEDQAESVYFSSNALPRSAQLTHLLFRNIRTEFFYRFEKDVQFFQYRTRAGVVIPLALKANEKYLAFVPIDGEEPNREEKAAGDSFLKNYRDSKVVFFHEGFNQFALNDRMIMVPLTQLI